MNEERYLELTRECEDVWDDLMTHCRPICERSARHVAHTGYPALVGGDASYGVCIVAEERMGYILFATIDNSGWTDGYAFPTSDRRAGRLLEQLAGLFDELYGEGDL
jgi:hypothetical protein